MEKSSANLTLLTFSFHTDIETLFEPAELAVVSRVLVDDTVHFVFADIGKILLYRPLEETFTALTTEIMCGKKCCKINLSQICFHFRSLHSPK